MFRRECGNLALKMRSMKLLLGHCRSRGWLLPRELVRLNERRLWSRHCTATSDFDGMNHLSDSSEFTDYLDSLTNYERLGLPDRAGIDSDEGLDLGRMRRLLDRLGNPHTKFKVVHIAGTKGKGSIAAYLAGILRAEGYSVGCYTSPHILSIRERMTLGNSGDPVSVEDLSNLFHRIKKKLDEAIQKEHGTLTHFEVLTAVAFLLFADKNVEIVIVEAGLGGARDATNVFDDSNLVASVITTIGEEHLLALGGSLESIALAKAGIIKPGRPVILGGPFLQHIKDILLHKASLMGSPVISAYDSSIASLVRAIEVLQGRPCQSSDLKIQVEADSLFLELSNVKLRMLGIHQLQNACTAACTALCLRNQGWKISDNSMRVGLEHAYLPGRSQFLSDIEVEALGLPRMTMLLDGAHTQGSAKALVDTVHLAFPGAHVALVVAMADDKDHSAFAKELLLGMKQLVVSFLTEVNIAGGKFRTASGSSLRDHWLETSMKLGINARLAELDEFLVPSEDEALQISGQTRTVTVVAENSIGTCVIAANKTLQRMPGSKPKLTIVTGSLHAVSSVLALFQR